MVMVEDMGIMRNWARIRETKGWEIEGFYSVYMEIGLLVPLNFVVSW